MTEEQRLARTLKVMNAIDEWGLSGEQALAILNFPKGERSRHLQKYRKDTAFPDEEQINNRVVRLLGIIDALRTSYQETCRWAHAGCRNHIAVLKIVHL